MMPEICTIIAVYGETNQNGDILTHQAAMAMFDQLRQQETMPVSEAGYYLKSVQVEGDVHAGKIIRWFAYDPEDGA